MYLLIFFVFSSSAFCSGRASFAQIGWHCEGHSENLETVQGKVSSVLSFLLRPSFSSAFLLFPSPPSPSHISIYQLSYFVLFFFHSKKGRSRRSACTHLLEFSMVTRREEPTQCSGMSCSAWLFLLFFLLVADFPVFFLFLFLWMPASFFFFFRFAFLVSPPVSPSLFSLLSLSLLLYALLSPLTACLSSLQTVLWRLHQI